MTTASGGGTLGSGRPPRRVTAGYAIGSFGTGGFGTLPGLVLLYYLTDSLGVAALAAGVIIGLAKLWDVVIDPFIGQLSDHDRERTGSRRRLMLIGAAALPALFMLTFAVPPGLGPTASAAWVAVAFILATTAFSLFQVPYIALPAEIAPGYDARTRLLSWRIVVLTTAILLFGAGGPLLRGASQDERSGYLVMAIVAGLAIGGGLLVAALAMPSRSADPAPAARSALTSGPTDGYRRAVRVLREIPALRSLLGAFALQALATGVMLAAAQYVATWLLGDESTVTLLFLALVAPALIITPVWAAVARRVGKETAYTIASALFGFAALALVPAAWTPGPWLLAPVVLAGSAYAGLQMLPLAMLPDVIDVDARRRGASRAGVIGGVWTAGETAGMALGATLLSIVLAASGYVESTVNAAADQPPSALLGIGMAFSAVPAALLATSLLVLRGYRLRRRDLEQEEAHR